MKIRRIFAPNMREAMRMVRQEQGDDAVILSNQRVDGGIEVVSAIDYDAALMQQAVERSQPARPEQSSGDAGTPSQPACEMPKKPTSEQLAEAARKLAPPATARTAECATEPSEDQAGTHLDRTRSSTQASGLAAMDLARQESRRNNRELQNVRAELKDMRELMERQVAGLVWNDMQTRHPVRAETVRLLASMGVDMALARQIAGEIPDDIPQERARFISLAKLSKRIPVFRHEWLDQGGVVALVGATGVGKTTTIAKLAARYVQNWGLRDVALVTTDSFRIGAQEQLFTYGRLLGVPVLTADSHQELCEALDKLSDRKLVLIDTAGISPRDENLSRQVAMLSGLPVPNRTALVMSASATGPDFDAQFTRFGSADPSSVILTKLDESNLLGTPISAIVKGNLPVSYVTDGQRVPEDIAAARADQLVLRANEQQSRSQRTKGDDDLNFEFAGAAYA